MAGIVTQEALQEVVSLEELKMHLRVDGDLEDGYLTSLIRVAVDFAENFTKRSIVKRVNTVALDSFPVGSIRLPTYPVQEIQRITYKDILGEVKELPSESYQAVLDVEPPLAIPISSWPSEVFSMPGNVKLELLVGYEQVPMSIKQAILLLCGHFYENREVMRERYAHGSEIPFSVSALLYPYKVLRW